MPQYDAEHPDGDTDLMDVSADQELTDDVRKQETAAQEDVLFHSFTSGSFAADVPGKTAAEALNDLIACDVLLYTG